MAQWTLITGASLVPAPWRNGLGTSRDIARQPAPDGGLGWIVSIADLEQDADFSHYPDCDRIFTPIAGDPPPELAFEDGPFEPCPLLVAKPFPGDVPTRSRIPAPGRAFNVIVDRRLYWAAVTVLQLPAGSDVQVDAGPEVVLHCLTGGVTAGGARLGPGDSLVGSGKDGGGHTTEDSVLLVVTILPGIRAA